MPKNPVKHAAYIELSTTYNSQISSQKYSPFSSIKIQGDLDFLLACRIEKMGEAPVVPEFSSMLETPIQVDNHPFLVISSGRAKFIAERFTQMREALKPFDEDEIHAINLLNGDPKYEYLYEKFSFFYDPLRTNRPLIILVHKSELEKYRETLFSGILQQNSENPVINKADNLVTLVGWESGNQVGFGATRHAAIAFLKKNGIEKAWLVDDDVIHLHNLPRSLFEIEKLLNDKLAAIGFSGATKKHDRITSDIFSSQAYNHGTEDNSKFLVQQAAVWNISYLQEHQLNFSPYFVTGGEDLSFSIYLNMDNATLIHPAITVKKLNMPQELADKENLLLAKKTFLVEQIADSEGRNIRVRLGNLNQDLSLSEVAEKAKQGNAAFENTPQTICHMTEQMACNKALLEENKKTKIFSDESPSSELFGATSTKVKVKSQMGKSNTINKGGRYS